MSTPTDSEIERTLEDRVQTLERLIVELVINIVKVTGVRPDMPETAVVLGSLERR